MCSPAHTEHPVQDGSSEGRTRSSSPASDKYPTPPEGDGSTLIYSSDGTEAQQDDLMAVDLESRKLARLTDADTTEAMADWRHLSYAPPTLRPRAVAQAPHVHGPWAHPAAVLWFCIRGATLTRPVSPGREWWQRSNADTPWTNCIECGGHRPTTEHGLTPVRHGCLLVRLRTAR